MYDLVVIRHVDLVWFYPSIDKDVMPTCCALATGQFIDKDSVANNSIFSVKYIFQVYASMPIGPDNFSLF